VIPRIPFPRLIAVITIFLLGLGYATSAQADSTRIYPSKIDGYAAPNPGSLAVRFQVYNDGTQAVGPECTISAQDDSGAYHGFNVFDMKSIPAGTTVNSVGDVVITSQGANYVTQVKISCTAQTSDKGKISGLVTVISVDPPTSDGYAGHDSSGWFWGAIVNVSGVTNGAEVTCTAIPKDLSGKPLTTYTFSGQVNGGSVAGTLQTTTANIGSKIKKVVASCVLGQQSSPVAPASSMKPSSTPANWYPNGYEEDSPGFAFKWSDNAVNCPLSSTKSGCWNGQVISKNGCPHGLKITFGLFADNSKKEIAQFSQKYFANFKPFTPVMVAATNPITNPKAQNAQIDSDSCLSAKEGGNNPAPKNGENINVFWNNFTPSKGDSPVGANFFVGTAKIKCSAADRVFCATYDIENVTFCPKGLAFSGFIGVRGQSAGWAAVSGDAGDSKTSAGVPGGTEISAELDFSVKDLVNLTHLSALAVESQLALDNVLRINKVDCLS